MSRLGNPLVYDLLDVAESLARQSGRMNLRKAAMRRAVSSAYYAVFHAFCFVCASVIVGWKRSAELESVYRMLDHGQIRKRLTSPEAAQIAPDVARIGATFTVLQERRHLANYSSPALPVSRNETLAILARAREAVEALESLGDDQRRKLAVLLITKARLS
ncbi:hypothetical protein [Methylobacterium brachiatum]|uniref:hypothetical protein n=1 Tax=Methylobacterium brachiatum TaxID=269660 RepID=UPI000EFAEE2A|nr:hypothetical protein [Methylobacterium brachiatum]AYO85689.1 hypothetical protein EBB05_27970 [Methylobacterium brachiatum]